MKQSPNEPKVSPKPSPHALRRLLLSALLLGAAMLSALTVHAQAAAPEPAFPPPCSTLSASQPSTPNGPASETAFDTTRIQAALDACPAGKAVELVMNPDTHNDAFLIAPMRIPAGVTLLIDAGVTVFGSRNPADYLAQPLIQASSSLVGRPSAIMGYGILDGRGDALLLEGGSIGQRRWSDLDPITRPTLIDATGASSLYKITLRNAPMIAVHYTGTAGFTLWGVKIVNSAISPDTQGIVIDDNAANVSLVDSTLSTSAIDLALPSVAALTLNNLTLYAGSGIMPEPAARNHCVAAYSQGVTCTPASLPTLTGELFLSTPSATNLQAASTSEPITLNAVLIAPDAATPAPTGLVSFFDTSDPSGEPRLLGTASLNGSLAQLSLPHLASGIHTITAAYPDASLAFGAVHVDAAPPVDTTTSVSASATSFYSGASVTLTAAVTPLTATGIITFLDGSQMLAQVALSAGSASFSTSSLSLGPHAITASYGGDSLDAASVSPILSITIKPNPTTVTLTPLASEMPYGSPTTLSASVTPAAATGTIVFRDSFTPPGQTPTTQTLGQASVANGTAVLSAAPLAVGTHTITALYSGDTVDLPATSAGISTQIDAIATSTTLGPVPATVVYGTAQTFTASVSPADATGTITFHDSASGTLGQSAVVGGAASLSNSTLAAGLHTVSAIYLGDAIHASSSSSTASIRVSQAASSTVLAALPATIYLGTVQPLTASVSPASATGTVTFTDSTFGTLGQATIAHGVATFALKPSNPGSYSISAAYSGDTNFGPSTSAPVSTVVTLNPTTTTLALVANSQPLGSAVTLTATIAPSTATGVVNFSEPNSGALGSALVVNGTASIKTSSLALGARSIHASYLGDSVNAPSIAAPILVSITPDSTSTTLTLAQVNVPAGSPVTFNVRVASGLSTAPTGTVVIRSGSTMLASGPLSNASSGSAYATLSINSTTLGLGTFPVAAFYSGDVNDTTSDSTSTPASFTVVAIPVNEVLMLSSARVPVQTGITLTVALTATSSAAPPSGTVTFLDNGVAFAAVPVNASGTASTNLSALPVGAYTLSATYAPTGLFAASSAAPQILTVTLPVAIAFTPATLQAAANSAQTSTLVVTPLSGFSGAIAVQCTTPATFITCTVDAPASIATATPVNALFHISLAGSVAPASASVGRRSSTLLGTLFALLLPVLVLRRRPGAFRLDRLRLVALLGVLALLSTTLSGCAEGGDFFSLPTGSETVTATVTAAGTAVTSNLTVNITQ